MLSECILSNIIYNIEKRTYPLEVKIDKMQLYQLTHSHTHARTHAQKSTDTLLQASNDDNSVTSIDKVSEKKLRCTKKKKKKYSRYADKKTHAATI